MRYSWPEPIPLISPALVAAAQRLQPCPEARWFQYLIRTGRTVEAAAVAERMLVEAD
jgi:DNA-binding helix-hairpin-helix protein with protein kinase domain